MKNTICVITVLLMVVFAVPQDLTQAQNSGERYVACLSNGCAIIGNAFCGYANVHYDDGTVGTYWCVIIEIVDEPIYDA